MFVGSKINLDTFFLQVAENYSAEQPGFGEQLTAAVEIEKESLRAAYFGAESISYSDNARKIAYLEGYAPRWSEIWQSFTSQLFETKFVQVSNGPTRNLAKCLEPLRHATDLVINSVGTGPGSEIFGLLCGLPDLDCTNVTVHSLERESSWNRVLKIAAEEFATLTGIQVTFKLGQEVGGLERNAPIIGSFILSETTRQSQTVSLMEGLRDNTDRKEAWFMDSNYKVPGINEWCDKCLKGTSFEPRFDRFNTGACKGLVLFEVPLK